MKFNTLNVQRYANIRKSFCWRPRDLRKFAWIVCYRASYERCNHGRWVPLPLGALSDGRYGEPTAGSSQLHSMTLAAPIRGELRLRQLKLTEGHRMMTAGLSCTPKILAAVSCTLRPWLHPAGVSFSWRGQLSRAGNKHSNGQCFKVIFNFML